MATAIQEVLQKLQQRTQSQEVKQVGYESRKPEYDCSKCLDRQGYIEIQNDQEVWVRCNCIQWRKVRRLMKSSDITDNFTKLGFKNFNTDRKDHQVVDMYRCANAYYSEFDNARNDRQNSISLLGQPGSGKTHLLMAISNNLLKKKHVPVQYFPFVEGFSDLKDDFDQLEAKLDRMKQVDVLFIDDLFKPARGKPRATEWSVEQMYNVINYRYLNHNPIMISSELNIDQLCDVDEALGTRIFEMCKDYVVEVQGDRKRLNHRLGGLS